MMRRRILLLVNFVGFIQSIAEESRDDVSGYLN
jgi:hypothetical protein